MVSFGASGIPSYMTPSRTPTRRSSGASASRTSAPTPVPTRSRAPSPTPSKPTPAPTRPRVSYTPPPPPTPVLTGEVLQAQEAQRRALAAASAAPAYTPWTGGGNDAWMGSPGDQGIIEYGVNRTTSGGGGDRGDGGDGGTYSDSCSCGASALPVPPILKTTHETFATQNTTHKSHPLTGHSKTLKPAHSNEANATVSTTCKVFATLVTGPHQGLLPCPTFLRPDKKTKRVQHLWLVRPVQLLVLKNLTRLRGMQGMWDIEGQFDPYSAAARGTRGLRDEFAARGTLRGTDFGQTFGEFQNRLNEQLEAMETGRTRFAEDLSSELAQQRTTTEERRQAAERAAVNRADTAQMNAFTASIGGG